MKTEGKMKDTIIVNLFGGPGSGKSTGATWLFSQLKLRGIDCEYVSEFAKDKVWEDNSEVFANQFYLSGKQSFKISRCFGKVDIIITDCPIAMACAYSTSEKLNEAILEEFGKYGTRNINAFIRRDKEYNPNGRNQSYVEAKSIDETIQSLLTNNSLPYLSFYGNEEGYGRLLEKIVRVYNGGDIDVSSYIVEGIDIPTTDENEAIGGDVPPTMFSVMCQSVQSSPKFTFAQEISEDDNEQIYYRYSDDNIATYIIRIGSKDTNLPKFVEKLKEYDGDGERFKGTMVNIISFVPTDKECDNTIVTHNQIDKYRLVEYHCNGIEGYNVFKNKSRIVECLDLLHYIKEGDIVKYGCDEKEYDVVIAETFYDNTVLAQRKKLRLAEKDSFPIFVGVDTDDKIKLWKKPNGNNLK